MFLLGITFAESLLRLGLDESPKLDVSQPRFSIDPDEMPFITEILMIHFGITVVERIMGPDTPEAIQRIIRRHPCFPSRIADLRRVVILGIRVDIILRIIAELRRQR